MFHYGFETSSRRCLGLFLAATISGVPSASSQSLGRQPHANSAVNLSESEHGQIHHLIYTTDIAINLPHNQEEVLIYTPPGYDADSPRKYPVLYLLHGFAQNAGAWVKDGELNVILDQKIADGEARPMIVVMPLSYGNWRFVKWGPQNLLLPALVNKNVDLFSRVLLDEIMPRVESAYNVSTKRQDRAIAGNSMGGLEALTIGFSNPRKFAWIGGFSSSVQMFSPKRFANASPEIERLKLLWIGCGASDIWVGVGNKRLIADLENQGLSVTSLFSPGGHHWPVWQTDIKHFLPLLFQSSHSRSASP